MNKLYIFSLLFFTIFNTSLSVSQTDLELVKPIINIADSLNGGYYGGLPSNHVKDLAAIYTGAIIKNNGQDTATNYFLKVNAFMQSNQANDSNITLYSDTFNYLVPGAIDTIRFPVIHARIDLPNQPPCDKVTISYQLFHDSLDATPENDTTTLPIITYYIDALDYIGTAYRLGEINDTVNLINHPQYPSGSFIGISTPIWLSPYFGFDNVYLAIDDASSLQNINLEFRIYVDTTLFTYSSSFSLNTTSYFNPFSPPYFDSLSYIGFNYNFPAHSYNDSSILTAGIYFEYDTTASNIPPFKILADTGNYHSFEIETRTLVNGTWQSADFVPLIIRDLLWESIEEYQNTSEVSWFPNPASEQTTLRIRQANLKKYPATVTILDISGKKVLSAKVSNNQSIDISALSPGVYMVLTHINGQRFASKLIKP